eukprot:1047872_1
MDKKDGSTLMMGGVRIAFPYKSPYAAQKQVMAKVIHALKQRQNALLESPTGSGKSLAILCSVLAWHKQNYPKTTHLPTKPCTENQNRNNNDLKPTPKPPKIIFTSRTHGQLQQLIAEYRRTQYYSHFTMTILGSRKQLCINPKIQPLFDRNDQCKKALDLHDCRFYRNKMYAERFKANDTFGQGRAFDIEDLVSEGTKMGCCPYFGSRSLLERASLIFCPYNYILDPVIRTQMKINIKDAILVIDEAHNVEDVCRSTLTKSYSLDDLTASIDELHALRKLPEQVSESASEIKELITMIRDWMRDMDDTLGTNDYKCHRNVYPHTQGGDKLRDILKKHWQYDPINSAQYADYAQNIFAHFQEQKQKQKEAENPMQSPRTSFLHRDMLTAKTSQIIEYLALILLPRVLQYEIDFNIALLPVYKSDSSNRQQKVKVVYLHFWCLSPSVAFKPIGEETRSVILTSGTLSPLESLPYELKCKFEVQLVADHVIEKGQIVVTSIERGINGNELKLKYSNLQQPTLQDDLGVSLLHLLQSIPQGIVVFFSSYGSMQTLIDRWVFTGTYNKMMNTKNIYVEPKGSDEEATKQFMNAIETFGRECGNVKYINKYKRSNAYKREMKQKEQEEEKAKAKRKGSITKYLTQIKPKPTQNVGSQDTDVVMHDSSTPQKGAVFFGVCRGKISEGIDFSDGMSRAVILLGIPYPSQKEAQVYFKKIYNNKEAQKRKAQHHATQQRKPYVLDGNAWYSQQAFRALNQALGRCIRHKYDYGVIIFLESRFHGPSNYSQGNVNQLSKWIRPYMRSCLTVKQAVNDLITSFDMPHNKRSNNYTQNAQTNHVNRNGNTMNGSNNRKRKYALDREDREKENGYHNTQNTKRIKLDTNLAVTQTKPKYNCAQCQCSAMICRGSFEHIELVGGDQTRGFIASKQPFPCVTSKNCIWSSQLGLTFMYKRCVECDKAIGFHVVGAMQEDKLKYIGNILFIPASIRLLTIR